MNSNRSYEPSDAEALAPLLDSIGHELEERSSRLVEVEARIATLRGSPHFALESRLLLVSLHAGKRERKFDEATRHAERLVREHGTAVVALDAAGRAMLTMGRADQAAAWLDRAVAESKDRVHPSVAATLRLHRARCELARSRPDLALTWLEPLLARPATVPVSLRKDVAEAAAAARGAPEADLGRRPYRGVAPS